MLDQGSTEQKSTNNAFTLGWPKIEKSHGGVLVHLKPDTGGRARYGSLPPEKKSEPANQAPQTRMTAKEREHLVTRYQSVATATYPSPEPYDRKVAELKSQKIKRGRK